MYILRSLEKKRKKKKKLRRTAIMVAISIKNRLIARKDDVPQIEIKTHPFQQTSQPQEFNIGAASSALFIGMDFVLLPITLAIDMVYDREVRIIYPMLLINNAI